MHLHQFQYLSILNFGASVFIEVLCNAVTLHRHSSWSFSLQIQTNYHLPDELYVYITGISLHGRHFADNVSVYILLNRNFIQISHNLVTESKIVPMLTKTLTPCGITESQ